MLFWIFVIVLAVGVACIVLGDWMYDNTKYDTEWLIMVGWAVTILAALAVLISGLVIAAQHITADAYIAENHEKYKSLTYQLENDLYDNDNDFGKKALYDEIREWNEDLAHYRTVEKDFWLGIFYPDVFDQFEFIEYVKGGAE
jgi:hypothetical protein